jgi:hypothetical protein
MERMEPRYLIVAALLAGLLLASVTAAAAMLVPAADQAKERSRAPEKSPVIDANTDGNWELEKVEFVHYARPPCNNNGVCEPELGERMNCADCKGGGEDPSPSCYKLMGVKWKALPVDYVINPDNPYGLDQGFVTSAISASAEAWDAETSKELSNDAYEIDYAAEYDVQDYVNAIVFGDHEDSNVIAVATVWYTPRGRRIVEFDIQFNTDYRWGNATDPPEQCEEINGTTVCYTLDVMDLENIAVHEYGHGLGLDDIYNGECSEVTMYGYSGYNEMKKRSLEQPDIEGIQKLYGA